MVNNVSREALVHVPAIVTLAAARNGDDSGSIASFPLVFNWHGMMEEPQEQQGRFRAASIHHPFPRRPTPC